MPPGCFNVRWGGPDGTKLSDLDTGHGHWYAHPSFEEVGAAMAWTGNWDEWQQSSTEARGVMLEYHRERQKMEAWEAKERERKLKSKQ